MCDGASEKAYTDVWHGDEAGMRRGGDAEKCGIGYGVSGEDNQGAAYGEVLCGSVRFPEEVFRGGGLPYRAGLWQEQCVHRGNGMEGRISAENAKGETEQGTAGSEESGR